MAQTWHPRIQQADSAPAVPSRRQAMRMVAALGSVVYAVRIGELIKIGWTSDIAQRVNSFGACDVLAVRPGPRSDETAVHRSLSGRAVRGREWYSPSDPAVMAVVNDMRASIGASPLSCS